MKTPREAAEYLKTEKGITLSKPETYRAVEILVNEALAPEPDYRWECEDSKSPDGKCDYNEKEDPCRDSCIYCGQPEERK